MANLLVAQIRERFPDVETIGGPAMGANFIVPAIIGLDSRNQTPQIRHGFIVFTEGDDLRVGTLPLPELRLLE